MNKTIPASDAPLLGTTTTPAVRARRRLAVWSVLGLMVIVSGSAIVGAMRRTSPTFDEIVLVAGGARGFATGTFDLAPDHPPLMQYLYGLPVWLSDPTLPDESTVSAQVRAQPGYRYKYASAFYWAVGNDPERVSFLGRLPAVAIALLLTIVVFLYTRRFWGDAAGLTAAALTAFMPDVLAHGGVAYNDVPIALAILAAGWAVDETVRHPALHRGMLAGLLTGIAISVKISAAALLPVAVLLIAVEAVAQRTPAPESRARWRQALALATLAAVVVTYLTVVLVYRGDFALAEFRYGLQFRYRHMTSGHGAAAFLLGNTSTTGWWYYFPAAFLFKTSAAMQILVLLAAAALVRRAAANAPVALRSGARMPIAALLVFGGTLLTSNLNIGFRYAMPVLPLVCILTGAGAVAAASSSRVMRVAVLACVTWASAFSLSYYPHFLAYISEYGRGRDENYTILSDSSLDWGQGLLELRNFMRARNIETVYLSYFGSGSPAGYGINYVPLYSFFSLPPQPPPATTPEYVVISATNLTGVYFRGDPFQKFRNVKPDTVLGHTMFVYRLEQGGSD